ncbi:MAG TPA: Rne/Rng family ribonuclease [Desulfatiglandales bacterium]|nr:Rne/Rng family ribonuclease [Desulfatiglandales bacterium]
MYKMLINAVDPEEYRIAILKDGELDAFYIATSTREEIKGNIYKGTVARIEPSLQAAFINYGADKNGFLPIGEIHPEYYESQGFVSNGKSAPQIEKALKKGNEILVQVTKEREGKKGAYLTTYISLAGRYLVLTPGRPNSGISQKIEDEEERQRLKSLMNQLKLPEEIGYIVRTAASGQKKRTIDRDLRNLLRMWQDIKKRAEAEPTQSILFKEEDLGVRTLRDYFSAEVDEVIVDDKETWLEIKDFMKVISPRHQNRVRLYKEKAPIFSEYGIEKQIEQIYSNRVPLTSGGSIVIDSTEALISIDVNSGRSTRSRGVETTAYKTNLEAAREIARHLRLRDIGGLVVIDFIDMKDPKHARDLIKQVKEETKRDRAKMSFSNISKFGLMELSRQRLRPSIESKSYQICEFCQGRGIVKSVEAAAVSFLRQIWLGVSKGDIETVTCMLPSNVTNYLLNKKRVELAELEKRYGVNIEIQANPNLSPWEGDIKVTEKSKSKEA